jgi:hypothetical protein
LAVLREQPDAVSSGIVLIVSLASCTDSGKDFRAESVNIDSRSATSSNGRVCPASSVDAVR